jgi:hypothetical protein
MKGEKIGTICFTEDQSGSDLAGTRTTAALDGDEWVINGTKMWITNAPTCNFCTVLATTDPNQGIKALNFFLVEEDMPGFSRGQRLKKLGSRPPAPSPNRPWTTPRGMPTEELPLATPSPSISSYDPNSPTSGPGMRLPAGTYIVAPG